MKAQLFFNLFLFTYSTMICFQGPWQGFCHANVQLNIEHSAFLLPDPALRPRPHRHTPTRLHANQLCPTYCRQLVGRQRRCDIEMLLNLNLIRFSSRHTQLPPPPHWRP